MLLTEEEAKTKRCQESFGPGAGSQYPYHCIGSGCMAWRWGEPRSYEYGKDFEEGHKPADPGWEAYESYSIVERAGVVKFNKWRRPLPGRKGFCGKACQPTHKE